MKLTYTNVNGYLIPNLTYKSGEQMEQLGKYGFLRRDYLKNHRNSTYQVMLLQDTIGKHLLEVDKAAREREEVILKHKTISRRFLFSDYNRRSRIFEVPIWHLKNTRARKISTTIPKHINIWEIPEKFFSNGYLKIIHSKPIVKSESVYITRFISSATVAA